MLKLKFNSKQKGFTLIEMLVSVALFSVVLVVTLGAILIIADSNKKARSLMSVTNNLNFAVDSMVRSFKSGDIDDVSEVVSTGYNTGSGLGTEKINDDNCFNTFEIDYEISEYFQTREVRYCGVVDSNGIGRITKKINGINGTAAYLTSPDVDIDFLKFQASGTDNGDQPILNIVIEGTVKVSEKISSKFAIQTSVSQLKLNI